MKKGQEDDVVLKLLHTADWHLGRHFPSFSEEARRKLARARVDVLDRIFAEAERNAVDAVLCAGDLFDEPSPKRDWWEALATKLQRKKWKRPVFLLPGNHDPLLSDGIWRDGKFRSLLPDFVKVVDQELLEHSFGDDAVLYAVPCQSKAGQSDPTALIPKRAPGDNRVRVGMVHGSTFDAGDWQTNFPISKDAAIDRGLDYLAIGDTHGFRFVPKDRPIPPTIYPGAPEPTAFDESDPGYVALVLINRQRRAMVDKRRVAQWHWETARVTDLSELRALANRTDLANRVIRLIVEMQLSASEYQEADTLLTALGGNEANHAKVGVLQLQRDERRSTAFRTSGHSSGLPSRSSGRGETGCSRSHWEPGHDQRPREIYPPFCATRGGLNLPWASRSGWFPRREVGAHRLRPGAQHPLWPQRPGQVESGDCDACCAPAADEFSCGPGLPPVACQRGPDGDSRVRRQRRQVLAGEKDVRGVLRSATLVLEGWKELERGLEGARGRREAARAASVGHFLSGWEGRATRLAGEFSEERPARRSERGRRHPRHGAR